MVVSGQGYTRRAVRADEWSPSRGDDPEEATWWAVAMEPVMLPCVGARCYVFEADHPHRIVVWPDRDDPNMLREVESAKGEAVEYEKGLGDAVSFYRLQPS